MAFEGSISRRYAGALFQLADEADAFDDVARDLDRLQGFIRGEGRQFDRFMSNPGFSVAERRTVLIEVMERLALHGLLQRFLLLMLEKHRFAYVASVIQDFGRLADARAGRMRARLSAAAPLPAVLLEQVRRRLSQSTGQKVSLSTEVDPQLLAGLVVQIGDTVYDASLRARLEAMRNALSQSSPATNPEA